MNADFCRFWKSVLKLWRFIEQRHRNPTQWADLINGHRWEKFHDNSDWNKFKRSIQDVSGGTCPDIVIYSAKTQENRIYIEVKDTRALGYGTEDSQIIRYFLHLLVTTKKGSEQKTDL